VSVALARALRRRRFRLAATVSVVAVALTVGLAHSAVRGDHMGKAAAICLAVVASAATTIAAAPRLGRIVQAPRGRPASAVSMPGEPLWRVRTARARGHPAVLQVFRW